MPNETVNKCIYSLKMLWYGFACFSLISVSKEECKARGNNYVYILDLWVSTWSFAVNFNVIFF